MNRAVEIPIRVTNPLNGGHGHWAERARARRRARSTTALACGAELGPPPRPERSGVRIRLTRKSAGTLDGDGLQAALKSVRDGVQDWLGVDDGDPRLTWLYAQEKCKRGTYGVRIEVMG